jgi:hypothetical protein
VDIDTLESITCVARSNVAYIYADRTNKKIFAFIASDAAANLSVCHVFLTKSGGKSVLHSIRKVADIAHDIDDEPSDDDEVGEQIDEFPVQIFEAEYMGNALVSTPHPHSQNDVQRALLILKQQGRRSLQKIYFTVSSDSVQVIDRATEALVHSARLAEISFCAIDQTNKKIVALIVNAPDLSFQCHGLVFKNRAIEVNHVISVAFGIAAAKMKKENEKKSMVRAALSPTSTVAPAVTPVASASSVPLTRSDSRRQSMSEERQTEEQKRQGGGALNVFEAQYYGSAPTGESKGQQAVTDALQLVLVRIVMHFSL